jgi:hypothetical protein
VSGRVYVHVLEVSIFINQITVTPVLRGHLSDKEKAPYMTGDLLKEVQFL